MTFDEFINHVNATLDEPINRSINIDHTYQCSTDSYIIEYEVVNNTWFISTGNDVWVEAPTLDEALNILS